MAKRERGIPKMTAVEVEAAVARSFGIRHNLVVPNVSWGLFNDNHEADLVVLHESGYADEIEIKVTAADIKKDLAKNHNAHRACGCKQIRRLFFAVPSWLADDPNIPANAGILSVETGHRRVVTVRAAAINRNAVRFSDEMRYRLARLGCLRIWTFKERERRRIAEQRRDAGDARLWRQHVRDSERLSKRLHVPLRVVAGTTGVES